MEQCVPLRIIQDRDHDKNCEIAEKNDFSVRIPTPIERIGDIVWYSHPCKTGPWIDR